MCIPCLHQSIRYDLTFHYADFFDELQLEQPYVAGASVGGWIAAELAVHYPGRLLKLALIDALGVKVSGMFVPDIFAASPSAARSVLPMVVRVAP
jgi:pimeloyl-ACP methyl ester carboxylesterase